jgi:hypothetical protein
MTASIGMIVNIILVKNGGWGRKDDGGGGINEKILVLLWKFGTEWPETFNNVSAGSSPKPRFSLTVTGQ